MEAHSLGWQVLPTSLNTAGWKEEGGREGLRDEAHDGIPYPGGGTARI